MRHSNIWSRRILKGIAGSAALLAAVVLAAVPALAASLEWDNDPTPGAQGGNGTWNTTNTNWWNGSANVSWTGSAVAVFGGAAGEVSLGSNLSAHALEFDVANYLIKINDKVLTVTSGITDDDGVGGHHAYTFDANTNSSAQAIKFTGDATFRGTVDTTTWYAKPKLVAEGCTVTFDGFWQGAGNDGGVKSYWNIPSGGKIYVGPNAHINNNMDDGVNARYWEFYGDGLGSTFEFDPGFKADYANWQVPWDQTPADPWVVDGWSTSRLYNCTIISHHSDNLPTVHKLTGTGAHSHHGLFVFRGGTGSPTVKWITKTNPQKYDGGVYWSFDWTLQTQTDLTVNALWHEGGNVGFGPWTGTTGTTLTKTGAAKLIIDADQGWQPGSVLDIQQGAVDFNTNPNRNWDGINGYLEGSGNYLTVNVNGSDSDANFNADSQVEELELSDGGGASVGAGVAFAPTTLAVSWGSTTLSVGGGGTATPASAFNIDAGAALDKTGDGALTVNCAQSHGAGATLNVSGGTVNLNTDAGANLTLNVTGSKVVFGTPQDLAGLSAAIENAGNQEVDLAGHTVHVYAGDLGAAEIQICLDLAKPGSPLDGIYDSTAAANQTVGVKDIATYLLLQKALLGDADMDGDVDATDLATLGMNWNPSGTNKTWDEADLDHDGDVDATDLATLGMNWNPSGGGAATPEPVSLSLLGVGLAAVFARRRARSLSRRDPFQQGSERTPSAPAA